jgi:hypothetical protein
MYALMYAQKIQPLERGHKPLSPLRNTAGYGLTEALIAIP